MRLTLYAERLLFPARWDRIAATRYLRSANQRYAIRESGAAPGSLKRGTIKW
jgi:hypothetical protein